MPPQKQNTTNVRLISAVEDLTKQITKLNAYMNSITKGDVSSMSRPPDSEQPQSGQPTGMREWQERIAAARNMTASEQWQLLRQGQENTPFEPGQFWANVRQYAMPLRSTQQQGAGEVSDSASTPPDSDQQQQYAVQMPGTQTSGEQGQWVFDRQQPFVAQTQQAQITAAQSVLPGVSAGASVGSVVGATSAIAGALEGTGVSSPESQALSMLTWESLGEQGGPAFIRNWALRSYGLQRSLQWATGGLDAARQNIESGGWLSNIPGSGALQTGLTTASGALQLAQQHPGLTYGLTSGLVALTANMRNATALGESLGYGPPGGLVGVLGWRPPTFGQATEVGEAFKLERALLQGWGSLVGSGSPLSMTSGQASQTMDILASQGFRMAPNLDPFSKAFQDSSAAKIADNLVLPMIKSYPGLSPMDILQFDPMLRYGATSIEQLRQSIGNLGDQAADTNQTIGQTASSLYQVGELAGQMGSNPAAGVNLASGFTTATGLPAQVAGLQLQSPIMQGLALSRYGVLPSGLAQMNPGLFANLTVSELQMLQRVTRPFDVNRYGTIWGHRVIAEPGSEAQQAMMSNVSGIPYQYVHNMLPRLSQLQATGHMEGLAQDLQLRLDQHNRGAALADWNIIAQHWRQTGMTSQEWHDIRGQSTLQRRFTELQHVLSRIQQQATGNQIQTNANTATLNVKFTGYASRLFQQDGKGPNIAKLLANAGQGPAMNSVINSPMGINPYNAGRFPLPLTTPTG